MTKIYTYLLFVLCPFCLQAQHLWESINLADYYQHTSSDVQPLQTDFYVVDSVYCYLADGDDFSDEPITRQYNLAFTDVEGEVLESMTQQWDTSALSWQNLQNDLYTYDTEMNLIESIVKIWNTDTENWVNSNRTLNTPNENGDYTAVLNQVWSDINQAWENENRLLLDYNDSGFIQILEQELWDLTNQEWIKSFRIIYATTPEGQIGTTLFQLFQNGTYQNISREIYTFDPDQPHLEIERLTGVWVQDSLDFSNSSRISKSYDSNENLTTETHQYWYQPDSVWVNSNRFLRNYNSNGDVTIKTDLSWNGTQWNNFFQTQNVYDSVFNLLHFEVFQWAQDAWLPLNSCDFFWRFHHEVVSNTFDRTVNCNLQNPVRAPFFFQCDDLEGKGPLYISIFDLSGKLVYSKREEPQNFVNIAESISSGLYILNVTSESGLVFTKKIMLLE